MTKAIKVVELFAGVGGFRLAAERSGKDFDFIWSNQWEPGKKIQHAFNCYEKNFGTSDKHINEDISIAKEKIPAKFDLLVGGFPCQDYSVATTKARGIEGKKGVLWWDINWILKNKKPKFVLLENVDRLLKSPVNQRGRDFAIILKCFNDNGYNVEWMVNNASDFGFPQRRSRILIFGYKKSIKKKNIFFNTFDFELINQKIEHDISKFNDLQELSDNYNDGKFLEYGEMNNGSIFSSKYSNKYDGKKSTLGDILTSEKENDVLILTEDQLAKMKYYKEYKKIERKKTDGTHYYYTEGNMSLFDSLQKPARTLLTSEGSLNRSTHIIEYKKNKNRFLSPIECERLNGFPDNWTEGIPFRSRYFVMGNALIVGLIAEIMKNI